MMTVGSVGLLTKPSISLSVVIATGILTILLPATSPSVIRGYTKRERIAALCDSSSQHNPKVPFTSPKIPLACSPAHVRVAADPAKSIKA
jgi:hypothetical protein